MQTNNSSLPLRGLSKQAWARMREEAAFRAECVRQAEEAERAAQYRRDHEAPEWVLQAIEREAGLPEWLR